VDAEVLRALHVPVVLVEPVVERVGVGEVGVQRLDDLLCLLLVDPDGVLSDRSCFRSNVLLSAHYAR
jgi:hypothetical protein